MTPGFTAFPGGTARGFAERQTLAVPESLAGLFEAQAIRTPGARAVEAGPEALTYARLDAWSNRLAHELIGRGVSVDSPVAISIERSIGMLVAVLGVLKAGGACVPLDPAYPAARREYMLKDSSARWIVTQASTTARPEGGGPEVVNLARDRRRVDGHPSSRPDSAADESTLVYIIYTSGSTGQPKGVMLPQRALINLVRWQIAQTGFATGARTLQFSSLSFDVSFQELFATWASGGTVVLIDDLARRDPNGLLNHIIDQRIERIFLPFVALRGLADSSVSSGRPPGCLREVFTAGEQLQVDDTIRRFFEALPGCFLENQYGPSEAHVVTFHRLAGSPAAWPVLPPIGLPISGAAVHVLDENLCEVGPGDRGEIFIGGVCLARGYVGKPERTAERFVEVSLPESGVTRLYRTGDMAERLPDGAIRFHGRIDHQVKVRGYRVEPGEVSSALHEHPSVGQCVVTVRPRPPAGHVLVAYVVPRERAGFRSNVLRSFARGRLPAHLMPSQFVVVEAFPLTPSGKVDVNALPDPVFDRESAGAEFVAPQSPDELALARIWSRVLGIPEIGVRDDFFDLGGDSLLAVEVMTAIRHELGIDLTLGVLASSPTIATLAAGMRSGSAGSRWRSLVSIRTHGERTPLFCVHGGMANVGSFPLLARQLPADQPFYGFQWDGLTGFPCSQTIPAMARRYVAEMQTVQARGPYLLAGHCIGGLIAYEMAKQLRSTGDEVAHLFVFDTPNLGSPRYKKGKRLPAWKVLLAMRKDRRSLLEVWMRRALRRPVRPEHRPVWALRVMIHAAWHYRIPGEELPVTAIMTGLSDGFYMSLAGSWDDDAMGWTAWADRGVKIERVPVEHGEVLYHPATAEVMRRDLEIAHGRIQRLRRD